MSEPGVLSCRYLPWGCADAATNMAADESLLESAAAGSTSLRLYGWTQASLSLGYFQPAGARLGDPLWAQLPWVRRATGGGALIHHRELTYALALPADRSAGQDWIPRMHRILARTLRTLGVGDAIQAVSDRPQTLGDFLCFQKQTPGDLLGPLGKVAGSAQRKVRGALLQHGSLLLGRSEFAPDLPGIFEQTGVDLSLAKVETALVREFQQDTGWELIPCEWTPSERERTRDLRERKYAAARWNEKR